MGKPQILRIGTLVSYKGSLWKVVAFEGSEVLLLNERGHSEFRINTFDLLRRDSEDDPKLLWPRSDRSEEIEDAGIAGSRRSGAEDELMSDRASHLRELSTGYRSGSSVIRGLNEPRPEYLSSLPLGTRYQNKARELGVSVPTIRRWMRLFRQEGELGLRDRRGTGTGSGFGRIDQNWLDEAQAVVADQTDESTPTHDLVILRINERVTRKYERKVKLPGKSSAYAALAKMTDERKTFGGAKLKQSIASRPRTTGRLRATRPGEYVYLDTYSLDVYCMEPVTKKWIQVQLTAAMDLYDRCILGLVLTPVSTRSIDAAGVLYEVVRPKDVPEDWPAAARLPYHGVPENVVVPADKLKSSLTPSQGLVPETIIVDHAKIFLSSHLMSVCQEAGISVQPARPYQGSDKGPLERFFRTLRQNLLNALPGYKGPDVYNRGKDVEEEAFYFLDEMDLIIRDWIATVYHVRPHRGLIVPEMPGVKLTPLEKYKIGIARAGRIRVPPSTFEPLKFLPVRWHLVHHYGVELDKFRYSGPVVAKIREQTSPYPQAKAANEWPFRINPDDRRCIYFCDPEDNTWHSLLWEHAAEFDRPFNSDALHAARRLALASGRTLNDKQALVRLLNAWDAGLTATRAERMAAARLARERRPVLADAIEDLDLESEGEPWALDGSEEDYADRVLEDEEPDPDDDNYYGDAIEPLT
jgi:transposase InsO family protein